MTPTSIVACYYDESQKTLCGPIQNIHATASLPLWNYFLVIFLVVVVTIATMTLFNKVSD